MSLQHAGVAALAALGDLRPPAAPAERHRHHAAVQLRQRDHHRRLHRQQPARVGLPLVHGLELDRVRRDVGHVQLRQQVLRGAAVVVGGAADQAEPGQRHHGIAPSATPSAHEIPLDRRARVQAAGEGGDDAQALRLHRRDHAVIVPGVAGDQVGPQQHQPDRAGRTDAQRARQLLQPLHHAARRARVIQPDLGILDRGRRPRPAGEAAARAAGVAAHQHADQVRQVLVRPGQPVLQRQEVGPHVLRGAGDEAHQLRQPLQHLHLRLARRTARPACLPPRSRFSIASAPVASLRHVEPPEPGQLRDLAGGHAAQHGVAAVAPGLQGRQHRRGYGPPGTAWSRSRCRPRRCPAWQRASAAGSLPHSSAAWTTTLRPGISRASAASARATAPLRWLSMVTMTTRRPASVPWSGLPCAGTMAFMSAVPVNGRSALLRHTASPP